MLERLFPESTRQVGRRGGVGVLLVGLDAVEVLLFGDVAEARLVDCVDQLAELERDLAKRVELACVLELMTKAANSHRVPGSGP